MNDTVCPRCLGHLWFLPGDRTGYAYCRTCAAWIHPQHDDRTQPKE